MVADVEVPVVVPKLEKRDDNRKSNKPIMEKRRRARINKCLNELKALILDAMKKDPASHSKLEKADILEMTVKHLCGLRVRSGSSVDRFRTGYQRCLSEIARFPGLGMELRNKLVKHLEGLVPGARNTTFPSPALSNVKDATVSLSTVLISAGSGSGLHLFPTRLPNGDIALLLPTDVNSAALKTLGAVPTPSEWEHPQPPNIVPLSWFAPFSPASSGGSPPPSDHAPLASGRRTIEDKPWRPW